MEAENKIKFPQNASPEAAHIMDPGVLARALEQYITDEKDEERRAAAESALELVANIAVPVGLYLTVMAADKVFETIQGVGRKAAHILRREGREAQQEEVSAVPQLKDKSLTVLLTGMVPPFLTSLVVPEVSLPVTIVAATVALFIAVREDGNPTVKSAVKIPQELNNGMPVKNLDTQTRADIAEYERVAREVAPFIAK